MERHITTIPKNSREEIRIGFKEYQGHRYVDIRVYSDNGAKLIPTKKGIAINLAILPEVAAALIQADGIVRATGMKGHD